MRISRQKSEAAKQDLCAKPHMYVYSLSCGRKKKKKIEEEKERKKEKKKKGRIVQQHHIHRNQTQDAPN